jgi:cytochrome c2
MLRQLGGWLRGSHSFKECVTAHQSSAAAPKMVGTKLSTEAAEFMLA